MSELYINCNSTDSIENLLKLIIRDSNCQPYLTCDNKDESIESILRRLVSVGDDGELALNVCGCGGSGGGLTILSENESLSVANSIVETNVLNYTIPAGTLLTDFARGVLNGLIFNNSGDYRTITWRVYYGTSLIYSCVSADIPSNANNFLAFTFGFQIYPLNQSVAAQGFSGLMSVSSNEAAPTIGTGDLKQNVNLITNIFGQAAEDASLAHDLKITAELSIANAAFYLISHFRQIEY